jgi:SAM-dependent methyltransferase
VTEPPGAERREPPLSSPTYTVRAPLARWLRAEAAALDRPVRILDVGCGVMPYRPFFAPHAERYVGVDVANPGADLEGAVEDLPVEDASFDLVLCTQVLEHCADPAQAVRELRRVVAPGGRVLASTHGVQVYHPSPEDLWRWTHTGLERLFATSADWAGVEVRAGAGTAACVGMVLTTYLDLAARRGHVRPAGRAIVALVNRAAHALDDRSALLSELRPGSLVANYHVTARA